MPDYTEHYDLPKGILSENYSLDMENEKMDKIDAALHGLQEGADGIEQDVDNIGSEIENARQGEGSLVDNIQGIKDDLQQHKQDYLSHKNDFTTYRDSNNLKVAKVEKELSDYKSTMQQLNPNQEPKQTASGYGVVSLPKNAANGQVSASSIKGLTLTNIALRKTMTNSSSAANSVATQVTNIPYPVGNRVLLKVKARVTNSECTSIRLLLQEEGYLSPANITKVLVNNPEKDKWYTGFIYETLPSGDFGKLRLSVQHTYSDSGTRRTLEVDDIVCVNATTHGIQNLTETEINNLVPNYFSGTKSTISASRLKSVGKNLFDGKLELGTINYLDGILSSSTTRTRSTNKIKLQANTQYTIKFPYTDEIVVVYYDINNNYLGYNRNPSGTTLTFTTPSNTHYIRFRNNSTNMNNEIMLNKGNIDLPYEPYTESNIYLPNVGELRSLPNGTKDEIRVSEGRLIKRVSEDYVLQSTDFSIMLTYTNVDGVATRYPLFNDNVLWNNNKNDTVNVHGKTEIALADRDNVASIGKFYTDTNQRIVFVVEKGTTLEQAKTLLTGVALNYQLAEPVEMPIEVSGSLVSHPNGTVYVEPFVADAGVYADKIEVLHQDLPIKALEKLSKVDFVTGLETELDIEGIAIAEDKFSFTHPELQDGDIVFFEYEYDVESTQGEAEVEYYDSRYTIKDSVTDKFYKWNVTVTDGVPSIELVEV